MLKIVDFLLICLAGLCLYRYSIFFSEAQFTYFEAFIPKLFIDSAPVTVGSTFHVTVASLITGLLLRRYAFMPVISALVVGISFLTIEVLVQQLSVSRLIDDLLANPKAIIEFLKPVIMLVLFTYLYGLFSKLLEPIENAEQNFEQD